MSMSAQQVGWADVRDSHDRYLREMNCQVVHASLHARDGWARHYVLREGERAVGHGALLVEGPWAGTRTVFEFFVAREWRPRALAHLEALLMASDATHVQAQTNDTLLVAMLHTWVREMSSEKLLFGDGGAMQLPGNGALFRRAEQRDAARLFPHEVEPVGEYVLECAGEIAATGGVMYHYNPPYGDVFMEVAPKFRRRRLGAYLVQELMRVCREAGKVPCARCDPQNEASRQACLRAGFRPVGAIVSGRIGG